VVQLLRDRRFASVINACDAGREGELIFRYVVQYAGGSPPVRRMWISSMTDDAIRRGLAALRPGRQLDALGDAARARSEADWLVGMNATRAITARGRLAGHDALYSIGRVQTPTLAMMVCREQAIRRFEPRPYWEVRGEFAADGQRFVARWQRGSLVRLGSAELAEAICARDAADRDGPRVERLRARTVREAPPLLFDLTALQRTANRRFGFSAARTLELAQALYERHKVLTYPRTDARHLSSDVAKELPALFAALAELPDYAGFAAPLVARPPRPGRRVVDDAKVHDHHAVIPTGKQVRMEALDRDERRLFDLVVRRFLGAFYPDAEFAITEAWIRIGAPVAGAPAPAFPQPGPPQDERPATTGAGGGAAATGAATMEAREPELIGELPAMPDRYFARGRVRVAAGWQEVAGIEGAQARGEGREGREGDEPLASLPALAEGQALAGRYASAAKQTTPPPRYSEATLLGAMESAGKTIDDEALRLAMKDTGLGTPATRAAVIETLLRREYIERQRQHLVPTALGIALIDALPVASLGSAELTGAWEARLARIARGEDSRDAFMADIARYVAELVDAIRAAAPPAAPSGAVQQQRALRGGSTGSSRSTRGGRSAGGGRSGDGGRSASGGGRSAGGESTGGGGRSAGAGGTGLGAGVRGRMQRGARSGDRRASRYEASSSSRRSASSWTRSTPSPRPVPTSAQRSVPPNAPRFAPTSAPRSVPTTPPRSAPTNAPRFDGENALRSPPTNALRSPPTNAPRFDGENALRSAPTNALRSAPTNPPRSAPKNLPQSAPTNPPRSAPKNLPQSVAGGAPRSVAPASRAAAASPRLSPADASPRRSGARASVAHGVDVGALGCPRCRAGTLLTGSRGWGCSR
ncbi:MAG TPA: DNA topoisomerase, partial [Kofleriaceae bacterium]